MTHIKHWHIEYAGDILDQSGDVRRMVATYKALHNLDQATAIAALITAGYNQLVSNLYPPGRHWNAPRASTGGSMTYAEEHTEENR